MTDQHPIIPSYEQAKLWAAEAIKRGEGWRTNGIYERDIANFAARWGADQQLKLDADQIAQAYAAGADQELEACCEWLKGTAHIGIDFELLHARRPQPPSLKEQALAELVDAYDEDKIDDSTYDTIRRALEQLDD